MALATAALVYACSKDDDTDDGDDGGGSPDQAGQACEAAEDCYPDVDHAELAGEVRCLDRVRDGYCTHLCGGDEDCCAVEGECKTDLPQVCSPFESTGDMMCFLSCEPSDVQGAGMDDEQAFCQEHASHEFICRSSGGGSGNRKVCVPGDCGVGADCTDAQHCAAGLECLGDFDGGYCGTTGCQADGDCPQDSACVSRGDTNYCLKLCATAPDCTFCRHHDVAATCSDGVEFVDAGATGPVCVPPGW
jgi:hypothetical protein